MGLSCEVVCETQPTSGGPSCIYVKPSPHQVPSTDESFQIVGIQVFTFSSIEENIVAVYQYKAFLSVLG